MELELELELELEVRCLESNDETMTIQVPNSCTLHQFKQTLYQIISPSPSSSSSSVFVSICGSSPHDSLQTIGVTSGDLIFYSLNPNAFTQQTLVSKNSPSCLMGLPIDLKFKILESLSGFDLAKVGCVCSELKFLSSNNDLWKHKFDEEFGFVQDHEQAAVTVISWKNKFIASSVHRKWIVKWPVRPEMKRFLVKRKRRIEAMMQ